MTVVSAMSPLHVHVDVALELGAVRIESGARVRGDVSGEFSLEEGAEFVGSIDADFEMPAELGGGGGGKRR